MVLLTTPHRLVVLPGIIVIVWLLVATDVFPANIVASTSFIAILCTLVPACKWLDRRRPDKTPTAPRAIDLGPMRRLKPNGHVQ
jgi:hypothetical protein